MRIALVLIVVVAYVARARADVGELVGHLPPHANAIVAVDVKALGGGAARGEGKTPAVQLPAVQGLQALVLGARVHPSSAEPDWQVAVMRVGGRVSMRGVASASGGVMDSVGGREAALCRRDVYCVSLDDRTLGVVYPTDRQFAARWVMAPAAGNAVVAGHEYLRAAAAKANAEAPVVIAFDLKDALGEATVLQTLRTDRPEWADGVKGGDAALAALLASVRGATLRLSKPGAEGAQGVLSVDFARDAGALAPVVKQLAVGAVRERGLGVPDFEGWEYRVEGNAITGRGRLSPEGLERVAHFLVAPGLSAREEGDPAAVQAAAAGGAATPDAMAKASREYFKAVSKILDSFKPGASLTDSAAWLNRAATRIDQLPADNVDGDLLVWGASVGSNLRETAGTLAAGQQRVRARSTSVYVPAAHVVTDYNDPAAGEAARADAVNARRQSQQAVAEEKSAVTAEANKSLQAALDSRGAMRATMAKRYGGGF